MSEQRAREIIHQLATAVFYLHSLGITHRDLKPENILMKSRSESSEIKLVDFGLSITLGAAETSNELLGTLNYVAPEILMQVPYDRSVDIWALGILIHLLVARYLPFDSHD